MYQQPYVNPNFIYPQQNPNAVNINIISPQAYGTTNPVVNQNMPCANYSLWGQNPNPALPSYPQNYNNNFAHPQNMPQNTAQNVAQGYPQNDSNNDANSNKDLNNSHSAFNETNLLTKTDEPIVKATNESNETKTKKVTPLTNEYIMSLENYMNNENPKIRLIGTKELVERFKESETRKDNPSLIPLLNKALQDPSASIRFLALTALQLGYSVGNDETVTILKQIQNSNQDKIGEDSLLASEILLKLSGGQQADIMMTENEIAQAQEKANSKQKQGEKQ